MTEDNKKFFQDYINIYEFETTLPGSQKKIEFKPFTTGQIKKLLTYENESNYAIQEKVLDELITSSVLTEGFDIKEQYIYDRLFLLLELRKKTKGEYIEFKLQCPKCDSQSLNKVNLDNLELIPFENENNIIVDLSKGLKVHLRHIKRKHQIEDIKSQLFAKNLSDNQKSYMYQVAFHACAISKIETPNGMDENLTMKDRMYFVENIPMKEMEKITKVVDEMAFGWNLEHKIKCIHCDFEHTAQIPIQNNFFS